MVRLCCGDQFCFKVPVLLRWAVPVLVVLPCSCGLILLRWSGSVGETSSFPGFLFCSGGPSLFWCSVSVPGVQLCPGGLSLFWWSGSVPGVQLCSGGLSLFRGPVQFWWSGSVEVVRFCSGGLVVLVVQFCSGGPGWKVSCDLVSLFRSRKCGTGGYLLTSTSSPESDTCAIDSSVPTNHHGPGNQTPPTRCRPRPLLLFKCCL